ncbi:MAG TPA: hypothetical protein PKV27_13310, partial [Ilumatobacteraceae bacterium]|nr:hypothetical protein [Ilumatobacteraceae bacterium]
MEMEIDVSTTPSGLPVAQIGTFSWSFGTNVTSDVAVANRDQINAALAGLTFRSAPGFAGVARLVFEIDDQGNTGSGGVLSRTRFIDIDVCGPGEFGTAACASNGQPDVVLLNSGLQTSPGLPVGVPSRASDPDVGAGLLDMEVNVTDPNGVLPPAQVGTITWPYGTGVSSDLAVDTLANLNNALLNLTFTPAATLTGDARVVLEIDDNGNSGSGGELARTRFINIDVVQAPGVVRFTGSCQRAVGEGVQLAARVRREAGTLGAASVTLVAENVDAVLGSDYAFAGSSVASWANVQGGDRVLLVNILTDGVVEGNERFRLRLQSPSGVALAAPSAIEVTIRPDLTGDQIVHADSF